MIEGELLWHYEGERQLHDRCPRCGSIRVAPADYSWDGKEEHAIGYRCDDCKSSVTYDPSDFVAKFVMPGEPGSLDRIEDYDPFEGDDL